ncbi:MAG TPA: RNA polymerase sigma-70 factor [Aggregatilineales bacterium]|nr:RNA polymerase sigma-70 factor [Aggregatilineales bacterium]
MATFPDASAFEAYRPLMFSIAYRMLGTASEAEDIVQEAYLRYQGTTPAEIISHKAFLSTIVTRLCLNHLQSARVQRESYIGPWLPEPVLTGEDNLNIPGHEAELHDSLSIAFLTLLEQLTPLERAVFLLREVFDYDYAEIAEILGRDEAACRQMLSRAKKHVAEHRPRFKPTPEAHRQLLDEFLQAVTTGDLDDLMQLLSEDVVMWADGGGKARGAATHPLHGREAVARFMIASTAFAPAPIAAEITIVNGEQAVIIRSGESPVAVLSVTVDNDKIAEVRAIGNPDKLKQIK